MPPTFEIPEAAADLWRIIDVLENGEEREIVLTRDGKPSARLIPYEAETDTSQAFAGMSLDEQAAPTRDSEDVHGQDD